MSNKLKLVVVPAFFLLLAACATPYQNPDMGFAGPEYGNYVVSYDLEFENFNGHDFMNMEDQIRGFPGYRSHRISESTGMVTRVWYETSLGSSAMYRNLAIATERMGGNARISVSGNRFLVQRY